MQGPNREAVTLPEGSKDEPVALADLHPGDSSHPNGSWVNFAKATASTSAGSPWGGPDDRAPVADDVRLVPGGQIYWGAGSFRTTALPEKWHVNADGAVDAGE